MNIQAAIVKVSNALNMTAFQVERMLVEERNDQQRSDCLQLLCYRERLLPSYVTGKPLVDWLCKIN